MTHTKKLTPAEWEVMDAIWKIGGAPSVRDVLEFAYPNGSKAYTTIQTVMNTLEKKGFLEHDKIGLVNFYKPVKSRKSMVKAETSHLIQKVFNGSAPALANYLINSNTLTHDEIDEIKTLIQQKESQMRGDNHDTMAE